MRPSPKISICLAAISIGLLLVFGLSGKTEEPAEAQPNIKQLQQQRLALLVQTRDIAKNLVERARIDYAAVHKAERELFAARLEYAETKQDRIKACDQAIAEARFGQALNKARKEGGRGTEIDVLNAKEFELQAQIERMKFEQSK